MTNEEAIGHLQTIIIYSENDGYTDKAREALKIAIGALQKRKTGKWIRTKSGFLCSECKSGIKNQPLLMGRPMFCYCPFCGVKVEGCE